MSGQDDDRDQLTDAYEIADSFLAHWRALPKEGLIPHLRSYLDNPQPALQPHVAIIDVLPGGELKARLVGTERVALYDRNMTDKNPLAEVFSDEAKPVVAMLAKHTVGHPCGNRGQQTIETSKGRELRGVTMTLPLGVDNPDARCFVHFQHLAEPLEVQEVALQILRIDYYEWIDIGSGVPDQ